MLCSLCVAVCPAQNKSNPREKAISMRTQAPLLKDERENYAFFLDLPQPDRTKLKELFSGQEMPARFFIPINDTRIERIAHALARVHFGISAASGKGGGGLLGKLSGLCGR